VILFGRLRKETTGKALSHWVGLILLAGVVALGILAFPSAASAYLVERAGRIGELGVEGPRLPAETLRTGERDAEHALEAALRWRPANAQAYRLLARLHVRQGDLVAAARALAEYVALQPRNPQGHWGLAELCQALATAELGRVAGQPCGVDEPSRQAALIRHWQAAGQTATSFVQAGDERVKPAPTTGGQAAESDWAEVLSYYEQALWLDPESAPAWNGLAQGYVATGHKEKAFEAFGNVIAFGADPEMEAAAHDSRGTLLAGDRRWQEAVAEMTAAVALVTDRGQYYLDLGWYRLEAGGDPEATAAALAEAARLMPANPWPPLRLAQLAFSEEDWSGSVKWAEEAIRLQPDLFWGWVWKGQGLRWMGRPGEAEPALREAVRLAPDKAAPHAELGRVLHDQGRFADAVDELARAVSISPQDPWYLLSLADTYRAAGETALAVDAYRRVLALEPENSAAQAALQALQP